MKQMDNSGFSLIEVIVVIGITAVIFGVLSTANYFRGRNEEQELAAIQTNVNEAIIGYYGILGMYPNTVSGITMNADEVELKTEQVSGIADELRRYSGFSFIPGEVLQRYKFYLYYPNAYVFRVRCERRSLGSGLEIIGTSAPTP